MSSCDSFDFSKEMGSVQKRLAEMKDSLGQSVLLKLIGSHFKKNLVSYIYNTHAI